jgi:hypothetical protein
MRRLRSAGTGSVDSCGACIGCGSSCELLLGIPNGCAPSEGKHHISGRHKRKFAGPDTIAAVDLDFLGDRAFRDLKDRACVFSRLEEDLTVARAARQAFRVAERDAELAASSIAFGRLRHGGASLWWSFEAGLAHQSDALTVDFGAACGDKAQHNNVADPARAETPAAAGMPFEGGELE